MNYTEITKCRSCKNSLTDIISLGEQTSVGFTDKPEDGVKVPLELVLCTSCHLLQLKHSTNPDLLYNEHYGYRSGINETMKDELRSVVQNEKVVLMEGDIAVDIGCNDGTLLSNYPASIFRVGFDPSLGVSINKSNNLATYCQDNLSAGGAKYKIFKNFFNAKDFKNGFKEKKAKVVTSIAMFYDLEDPNKFLQDIVEILEDNGTLIIQQNYLVGMLENTAFDNVCHEHLEYYSLTSMESLLNRNGLAVVDVEEREINGGSFRIYARKISPSLFESPEVDKMRSKEKGLGLDTDKPYLEFASRVKQTAKEVKDLVQLKVKQGKKVYVYGASTRGNSLLQVCGIDNTLISGAAERNPTKYGKYTAGTKIEIVSEEEARKKADYFLCLPWFFKKEFIEREKEFLQAGKHLVFPLPGLEVI